MTQRLGEWVCGYVVSWYSGRVCYMVYMYTVHCMLSFKLDDCVGAMKVSLTISLPCCMIFTHCPKLASAHTCIVHVHIQI